jgi:hypothetical protein
MVQPTSLEPMPAMATATRAMAIIPIATATTPTVATDAFWFATSGRDGPANTAVEIVGALASLAPVTETGSSEAHQNPTTNVGSEAAAAQGCERALIDRIIIKLCGVVYKINRKATASRTGQNASWPIATQSTES